MEWRQATEADSFTQGQAVILTAHDVRGVVTEDTPAGADLVPVELRQGAEVDNEWDYAQLGNVTQVPPGDLSVLDDD